jgi:hypothetical protein
MGIAGYRAPAGEPNRATSSRPLRADNEGMGSDPAVIAFQAAGR